MINRIKTALICMALCLAMIPGACLHAWAQTGTEEMWQGVVTFPYWKGYTDDTLAMNSMYSFFGYHDQGELRIETAKGVTGFRLYVNGSPVDTSQIKGGGTYKVDISKLTKDGENTLQVSDITPRDTGEAVTVYVPYPKIISGTPEEEGISPRHWK